jgi:hypothetical protein
MNKFVILKVEIPKEITANEFDDFTEYYKNIETELNQNKVDTEFKMIFIPSDKYNISILYPNMNISKKELNKILDEQNENKKTLNNLDEMTRKYPELNKNVKQILRKLKIIEISDF